MPRAEWRRRTFLSAGLAAAVSCRSGGHSSPTWRFFTNEEGRTVDAICECLIPEDRDPGARQAGVVDYIDIQLTKALKKHQRAYRQGIVTVDATALQRFGKNFADLPSAQQADVLQGVEQNAKPFFQLILAHTQQGFYGDPRHGGNRNRASWKMIGLPYPQIRGRQRYEG